ncbi:MAG: ABC transporter permease [Micromonosporaceae bacterium]|nr:ABC transporter permease [Micromonosporaceae bacterium]
MLRATLKSLLARKLRLLLSGFAILLSVMFISAAFVFTDTIDASFDRIVDQVVADVDVIVTPEREGKTPGAEGAAEAGLPESQPTIPGDTVDTIRKTPGVASATATIAVYNTNSLRILGRDGKPYPGKDHSQLIGNWTGEADRASAAGATGKLTGRRPAADGEAVISQTLARTGPFAPGDTVILRDAAKQQVKFTVVGVFTPESGGGSQKALGVYLTDAAAQRLLLDARDAYQQVRVAASASTTDTALRDRLRASLGPQYTVETGVDALADQVEELKTALNLLRNILLGFVAFALFIGVFLIFNTFSIVVAQRTRELALLRALGASQAQIRRSVLIEAVATATVGSLLGFGFGCGLGWLGARFAANAGASIEIGAVAVTPVAVVVCFAVGILVTVGSAFIPAVRASRIPPVAALRATQAPDRPVRRLTIAGLVLGGAGVAITLYSAAKDGVNNIWVLLIFVGALLVLLGLALLLPFLTRPIGLAIGRVFAWSAPGRLGRLNAARKPRRTAITAAAMMMGVAVVAMFGTGFASSSAEVGDDLESSFHADVVVRPTWDMGGVLNQAMASQLAALPSVRTAVGHGGFSGTVSEAEGWISWYDQPEAAQRLLSLRASQGRIDALRPGEVLMSSNRAKEGKFKIGDQVTIRNDDQRAANYRVVGVFADSPTLYDYFIAADDPLAVWARGQTSWQYEEIYLEAAPGAEAEVKAATDALMANEPEARVQTREQYIAGLVDNNNTGMIILQVMMGLALIIAALGVVNTMVLSVIERTQELGMLRALGLSRGQTTRMIAVEAIVVSLLGAVLGILAGVGLAFALQKTQDGLVVIPWGTLVAYLVGAVLVGLVAAIGPAIRAGRLNVLSAISCE